MNVLLLCLLGGAALLNIFIAVTASKGLEHYVQRQRLSYSEENDDQDQAEEDARKDIAPIKFLIWLFVLVILAIYGIIIFT